MKKENSLVILTPFSKNGGSHHTHHHKEEKYRAIVENSMHAFFLTVPNGAILETNPGATVMFGYSPEEFSFLDRCQIIDHTDPNLLLAIKQRERTGFAVTEATGIKKNGERFPVEITSTVFTDTNGEERSSTMISDISIRKKAEAAMRLSNERFDLVVKATNDLVWDWDMLTGEIYRSGSGLAGVYGHRSNETIKNIQSWAEYLHPLDKEKVNKMISYYITSEHETSFNFEYRFRREDGRYAYISDKGYIIRNEQGKAIRMIGAAEDITERKKTALAIEESEQRYKLFVKQSTEGIWRIELTEPMDITVPMQEMIENCFANAYIAECNDAYAQMYGFTEAAELIGIPLHKLWPKENPVSVEYITGFFKNGFKATEEISHEYNRNGEQVIFLNSMLGIVEDDFLWRVWGTRRNITDQKKAEAALAESENHLRTIIQANPECIKLLSKEGLILEMNPAGLEMIEADSLEQVLGKNALNLVVPEYHEAFKQSIQHVFKGNAGKMEFEIIGFKGKRLCMETHCVPLRNAKDEIIAVLAVTSDITDRKNAEALLLASEERYRYLFNNNPASIMIWDIETLEIIEVNETAVELYGYSKDEFLKLSVLELRPKEDQAKFLDLVQQAKQNEFTKKTMTWHHLNNKGDVIIMEISSHNIMYNGKRAVLALGNNITEKVLLENSLNEERELMQQQITEAVINGQEKERTELGQELHDNINQILASTKLYIECALKDAVPRKDLVIESKILIERAMAEIRSLSKSLLPPSLGEIGLLQALCELSENIKQANTLAISIDWSDMSDELCNKLKLTIFRIVQEQLNNVIKHAGASEVLIGVRKEADIIRVSIKDNGQGFDTAVKRNGVGLRNITSRAEVNHGVVIINSKPGEGCELIVNFSTNNLCDHTN